MASKNEKDELDDVETISPEQAKKEIQQAVKRVHDEDAHKGHAHANGSKKVSGEPEDELDGVERIPKAQAEQGIRDAVKKVQQADKKHSK